VPAGRPTKLTPELIEDVRRILPTILYWETVADYLGVHRETFRRWLQRGAKEARRLRQQGAKPRKAEALYLEFSGTIKRGVAEGEIYDAGVIKKASAEQWTAAAWRLERRFPSRWAKRDFLALLKLKERLDEIERLLSDAGRTPS
jgi:transposase